MTRPSFALALISTLVLSPCLGGCAVAVVGGLAAAGGAGYEAGQERGLNGAYDDMQVRGAVSNALGTQFGAITPTVYQGHLLLTGSSPTMASKAEAERVASGVPGVTTVFNEVQIGPPEDTWQITKDSWITARVRSDLVFDADIRSPNYTIQTDHQSVFLIGSARSQAELDRATQIARYVPGVQRVVSYVEIRSGAPNGLPPGPSQAGIPPAAPAPYTPAPYSSSAPYRPAPSGGAMTPSAPPSSNSAIQVQKL
jgi:osmotically-inducible protein OsmY